MSYALPLSSNPILRFTRAISSRRNIAMIGISLTVYCVLCWLLLQSAEAQVRFRFDPTRFLNAGLALKLHVVSALATFFLGLILLSGLKGRTLHRVLGYSWVTTMALTAVSSFFLVGLSVKNLSLIHGLSAWTIILLPVAVAAARKRDIANHRKHMANLFVGGMIVAGLFTFLPGRMMWAIFFSV